MVPALLWVSGFARFQCHSTLTFPRQLCAWTSGRHRWREKRKKEPGAPAKVLTAFAESAHAGEIEAINNQRLALWSGWGSGRGPGADVQAPRECAGGGGVWDHADVSVHLMGSAGKPWVPTDHWAPPPCGSRGPNSLHLQLKSFQAVLSLLPQGKVGDSGGA